MSAVLEFVPSTISCRGRLAFAKILRKPGIDLERNGRVTAIDEVGDLPAVVRASPNIEVRARRKTRQSDPGSPGCCRIQHRGRDVPDLQCRRITEDEHLNHRRAKQPKRVAFVAEDLDEFLDQHASRRPSMLTPQLNSSERPVLPTIARTAAKIASAISRQKQRMASL